MKKLNTLGIQIYQNSISREFYKFLLAEYEGNLDAYTKLYQNQNFWGGADYSFVKDDTRDYVESNILTHVKEYTGSDQFKLRSQWINLQAHEGFVPLHTHSGNISYVIYLKIPQYLPHYWSKRNNDIQYAEGAIDFIYGHKTSLFPDDLTLYPEEGMIIMFPSEVRHYVYPFRDKESIRVSISGNLDSINGNNKI
jgi:hypothetical protein